MKRVILGFLSSFVLLGAGDITIAVAANVSYAMNPLIEVFHKEHPDTKVNVTLGSSGKLTAQISHGAPYQLFMAANMKYPERLYKEKTAVTPPVIYAKGALAMLSRSEQPFGEGMTLLSKKSIRKVALANPKTAPYGKAAEEAMQKAGLYGKVRTKLIFAESVSQTVSYTMTAADIGFVAKSSLYSPKMQHYREGKHWVNVDPTLYTPINQGIVILKKGAENPEVKAFYDFMLGSEAQEILIRFGYLVP